MGTSTRSGTEKVVFLRRTLAESETQTVEPSGLITQEIKTHGVPKRMYGRE